MSGLKDKVTGKVKEKAGDLSGNKKWQREGKLEQAQGKVKDKIDQAANKAKKNIKG